MARIGITLIAKPGWRPCPRCGPTSVVEFGQGCTSCNAEAKSLIESAMTPMLRRLVTEAQETTKRAAEIDAAGYARA